MKRQDKPQTTKIRIKKDDTVVIRAGKYKGQTGKVLRTYPKTNKVTVEGVNIVKRHVKPNREYPQGGIVEETKPIHVSNVGVVDPASKSKEKQQAARIGYTLNSKSEKTRVARQSGKEITS